MSSLDETSRALHLPAWTWALLLLAILFPLIDLPRPSLITAPPWKVELLASAALFAMALYASAARARTVEPRKFVTLLTLFAAWSGLSILWADASGPVIHHTFVWASYAAAVWLLAGYRQQAGIVRFSAILAAVLGLLCLFDFLTISDFATAEGTLRIRWAKYAELLITLAPMLLGAAVALRRKNSSVLLAIAASLAWIVAMLSLSKAAFLSGAFGFVIFFVVSMALAPKRSRRKLILHAAIWVLLTVGVQAGTAWLTSVPSTTQYISGTKDATRATSSMRIFTWKVTLGMIGERPLLGAGADNFGNAFNEGRKASVAAQPEDPDHAIGEDYLFERAHNEYLQTFAELGIVGLLLFAAAFAIFLVWTAGRLIRRRGRVSPVAIGALAGMAAFLVSSLFTSFSFRAYQNGLIFFAMAAFAITSLHRGRPEAQPATNRRILIAASLVGLFFFSGLLCTAQILHTLAERQTDSIEASRLLNAALRIYPENGGALLTLSSVREREQRYAESADLVERSIRYGAGASVTYARLAQLAYTAGDGGRAETALRDGISVFPRSTYLRVKLSILLENLGKAEAAAAEMRNATAIDPRQANGWHALIKNGSARSYQMSVTDPSIAGPAELSPQNGIYPYLDEKIGGN